jgi:2'-5' RNA ligase
MRLFVSVRPPPTAIAHLVAALPGSRTNRAEQWHITLAFLGDVPASRVLYDGLRDASARHRPFELRLAGGGVFGGARVVWAGVGGQVEQLNGLAADVRAACRAAGAVLDNRSYRPHVTVGKVGRLDPEALQGYVGPTWPVRDVELVHSVLRKTAGHTVLERFALYQA